MKGYKVFNPDWTCRGYDFKTNNGSAIGSVHKIKGKLIMCENGFHACEKVNHCFNYYNFNPNNKVAEIELIGDILGVGEEKQCAAEIKIIRELSWNEMLVLANIGLDNSGHSNSGDRNSGHSNSGDSNSGHRNSGHRNSGDWNSGHSNSGHSNSGDRNSGHSNSGHSNSGDWNSGHRNSGDWNSVNCETGMFNSIESEIIRVFNKECKRKDWENSNKPDFIYFNLTEWISFDCMSEEEKKEYPKAYVCDGYLKTYSYKDAWMNAYKKATKEDIELLKMLPNFDAKVFEEISGINIYA